MSLIGEENANKPDLMHNSVEEVKLRRRRNANKVASETLASAALQKKAEIRKERKKNQFLTPERLMKLSIDKKNDRKRFRRQSKRLNNAFIHFDSSEQLLAVLRIQSLRDASKGTVDIMKELRLTADYAVVFCRRTPELMRKLILVEPYVAWGHPNLTTIQELLAKHAFTIIDGKRVAVSDNTMVEDHLGSKNVICVADMQHEIQTMGPAFEDVTSFLAPFVLSSSLSRIEVNYLHKNSLPKGDQGEKINDIIKGML